MSFAFGACLVCDAWCSADFYLCRRCIRLASRSVIQSISIAEFCNVDQGGHFCDHEDVVVVKYVELDIRPALNLLDRSY